MAWRKCPCTRGCKDRSSDCHSSCEEYLKYENTKFQNYEIINSRKAMLHRGAAQIANANRVMRQKIWNRTGKRGYKL